MSATPPGASTEYSRGSGASRAAEGPRRGGPGGAGSEVDPGFSAALRAAVLGSGLLGALMLVVAEFTTLYTVHAATSSEAIQTVSTGSHNAYALIPIALVAAALAYGAAIRGSRPALLALGALGVATLLIALIGDLPDAHASGVIGSSATHFVSASSSPSAGLYLETIGAVVLMIASGCGLLLSRPVPARGGPQSGS
jgi:hypothetical protein